MENFFKPRKRKRKIDLSGEGEPKEPKEEKKKKGIDDSIKRGVRTGLNAETIPERINLMRKYRPKGDWRGFDKQKISYTELIQIWWSYSLSDKKAEILHFYPWEMRETMTKKLKLDSCKARYVFADFF